MADAIRVDVSANQVIATLDRLVPKATQGIRVAVTANTVRMLGYVQRRLSGEVLNVRTGRLRRAAFDRIEDGGSAVSGVVAMSSDVPYARIHEFGGRIQIPEIVPVKANALRFEYGGRVIFAKRTKAHPVDIPERPYMRPSLKEVSGRFLADMQAVANQAAKQ